MCWFTKWSGAVCSVSHISEKVNTCTKFVICIMLPTAARTIMGDEMEDRSIHTLDIITAPDGSVNVEASDYSYRFFEEDAAEEDADERVLD